MEKQKTIYDLELHEELYLEDTYCDITVVLRVHGGFIYSNHELDHDKNGIDVTSRFSTSTFVPYEEPIREAKEGIEVPQSLIDACKKQQDEKETD